MNIDRHNYEEFFILYLDNELSSEDRRQVELFVQANPDLQNELSMLQQAQFIPDTAITFDNKEELVRFADCDITLSNYEEWLVLYIDNELTLKQKLVVESFVMNHPVAKADLDILKKTRLQPEEAIVFPDKESLYRKEETSRRVVVIRWWRIAAAAILLLAIATASFLVFNNDITGTTNPPVTASKGTTGNDNSSVNTSSPSANQPKQSQVATVAESRLPVNTKVKDNELSVKTNTGKINNNSTIGKTNKAAIQNAIKNDKVDKIDIATTVDKNANNLPDVASSRNMSGKILDRVWENSTLTTENKALTNSKGNDLHFAVTPDRSSTLNSTEEADEIAQPEKKNKLRGFFRTIARTIEKKTNIKATDENDRLLIGGLAIKL